MRDYRLNWQLPAEPLGPAIKPCTLGTDPAWKRVMERLDFETKDYGAAERRDVTNDAPAVEPMATTPVAAPPIAERPIEGVWVKTSERKPPKAMAVWTRLHSAGSLWHNWFDGRKFFHSRATPTALDYQEREWFDLSPIAERKGAPVS